MQLFPCPYFFNLNFPIVPYDTEYFVSLNNVLHNNKVNYRYKHYFDHIYTDKIGF